MKKLFVFCTLFCSLQSILATTTIVQVYKDSIKERRDEYFKGVQIVIDDKPANVAINKPYEKLTEEQKEYYLSNIPEKEKPQGINESDFNSFTTHGDAAYYLDNKKVTKDEILKHERAYFACGGTKKSGKDIRYFFYTYPYFNKNIKTLNDHYSENTYTISILNEVRDYLFEPEAPLPGTGTFQRNGSAGGSDQHVELAFMSYGYTDEIISRNHKVMACFPGGRDKFVDYLFSNLKVPYSFDGQELRIDFTINTNGKLSDIYMAESTDLLLLSEVKRVLENCPRWIPSQENGIAQPVGTRDYFKKIK